MNVEVYSYSLFTTVLGMLVVFCALAVLSVMMVVLKRIFTADDGIRQRAKMPGQKVVRAEQPMDAQKLPQWLPLAVAAYLAAEQEPDRPSADPWNAVVNHYDPWISASSKRGV